MTLKESSDHPFSSQGLQLGGVYPFRIGQIITPQEIKERIKNSPIFCLDFSDREDFIHYRREMYNPEQSWSDPSQILFFETLIDKCVLSTGRKLEALPFQAYLTVYPTGFATIIFWIKLSEYVFQGDEIIELTALARGTSERINRLNRACIDFIWENLTLNVNNFVEICEMIEQQFLHEAVINKTASAALIRFAYPLVYIQEIPECKDAKEIIEKYPLTITGLANLWIRISSYLKENEVKRTIEYDAHPFVFGVNIISTCCHIELHPRRDEQYLKEEGLTFEENLYEERTYLSLASEVPVIQFFILRIYDAELSKIHIRPTHLSILNPLYPLTLVINAIQLTKLQQELTVAINQFRGIYLARRSWMQGVIAAHRRVLGTSNVEENIDKKLLALQNYVNTTYSMLTTIFILLLSVLATIFGIIQTIGAIKGLGWIH